MGMSESANTAAVATMSAGNESEGHARPDFADPPEDDNEPLPIARIEETAKPDVASEPQELHWSGKVDVASSSNVSIASGVELGVERSSSDSIRSRCVRGSMVDAIRRIVASA